MTKTNEPLPEGTRKAEAVRSMFDKIAPRYDMVNRIMTFGMDVGWRKRTVATLGLPERSLVLDIACGTGDLCNVLESADYYAVGIDMSEGMLRAACTTAPLIQGDGLALPIADVVDGITCGFALRNVVSLGDLFEEMARVLRPGGRIALLEVAQPERAWMRAGHSIYFNKVVPFVGGLLSDRAAYSYLPRSAAYLPPGEEMLDMLRAREIHRRRLARPPAGSGTGDHRHAVMKLEGPAALPDQGGCLWWHQGNGIVGRGRVVSIEVAMESDRGRRAWTTLRMTLEERRAEGKPDVAMGSLTFDPEQEGSVLFVPEVATIVENDGVVVEEAAADSASLERLRYARGQMDELRWLDEVAAAIDVIREGSLSKVVLARDEVVWSKAGFSERTIAMHLVWAFPQCFTFVCDGLVGATPELLVRRQGRNVDSLVLAGSACRGNDPVDDAAEATRLLGSPKERSEHSLAVDSVSDALKSACTGISTESEPRILQLPNLQHLATRVTAELTDPEVSVLELVDLLHPTAAVGGVPRAAALAYIRQAEGDLRGRYAGPVGWVNAEGDGEWGIGLRCALLSGNQAQLFAGAGVVSGSLPEAELEETRLKFRAMEGALGLTS